MLATILGVEFDVNESYNKRLDQWKLSDQIVRTRNITQTSVGKSGVWTTVVAAAIDTLGPGWHWGRCTIQAHGLHFINT